MVRRRWLFVMLLGGALSSLGAVHAGHVADAKAEQDLHIDVPVTLDKGNIVVDVGHLVFSPGDMPFLLGDLNLLATDYKEWGTKGKIVAVFHGDAAYLVLNDKAYNAEKHVLNDERYNAGQHVKAGNPYAELMSELMNKGVQIKLCGATAAANHWGNADLLPGVKVDTNAMVRVTQLEQQGYTMIYE